MSEFLSGMKRTSMCGSVTAEMKGKSVTVMGWANRCRDMGSLMFVQIRDVTGIVQAVIDSNKVDGELFKKAQSIHLEYVIAVKGTVKMRTEGNINPEMKTGEVELDVKELRILSTAEPMPFSIGDLNANEALRMKYRYLDLRREKLQQNLITKSKIYSFVRNYLAANGFYEIETPVLGKSTPEGARDYLVPSRVHNGKFYALPQSPQLFKQLLMISGMDRYYQVARCFRDEDLRANRQPEFTQLDIEMSFVDAPDNIFEVIEPMIAGLFEQIRGVRLKAPFRRMTYAEAMGVYGSDKPDLRFGMKLQSISSLVKECGFGVFESAAKTGNVKAIVLKGHNDDVSRKDVDALQELVKLYKAKGMAYLGRTAAGEVRCSFAKFVSEDLLNALEKALEIKKGDLAFIVADGNEEIADVALGELRNHLAQKFNLIEKDKFEVLWVTDFPLLEFDSEENRYYAKHHPFTSPRNEDIPLLKTDPSAVKAKAYDLVINGEEAGGGSLRIYDRDVQKLMFETLGMTDAEISERFGFFVDAFKYGTPPHGGIAFGLDRLAMILTDTPSIKDVIAFPKMQNACDLMTEAPGSVEEKQLKELGIKLSEENK